MKKTFHRRDFNKLSAAAFGGVVAGSMIGCGGGDDNDGDGDGDNGDGGNGDEAAADHACRGLNECNGKGAGGENECAGQGTCSTVAAHGCGGKNDCKYQGGCEMGGDSTTIANNDCAGKGSCMVPITDPEKWEHARANFATRMEEAGKTIGEAPAV